MTINCDGVVFDIYLSSNINEVIKEVISSLFIFFYEEILHTKKAQNANKRLSLRYFYAPKNIKSKQVTLTHKKHKTSNKLRFRRF